MTLNNNSCRYFPILKRNRNYAFLRYVPAEAVIHTGGVEFGITKGVKSSPADLFHKELKFYSARSRGFLMIDLCVLKMRMVF